MDQLIEKALRMDLTEEAFARLALDLLREQARRNPIYGDFLKASHFCADQALDWAAFPALPVEAFRKHAVTCFERDEAELVFVTSGTTSLETGRHYLKNGRCYEQALQVGFNHFMPDLREHCWISLVPSFSLRPHSSLAYMIQCLSSGSAGHGSIQYVVDGDFQLHFSQLREHLRAAQEEGRRVFLLGTSFSLAQAAAFFLQIGERFQVPRGSVVFDTGGYKGRHRELQPAELLEQLREVFGFSPDLVWNEYGMTELSSQGYGQLQTGLWYFPPWLKVRVIDPATGKEAENGKRGLLHFYDLANVHSVMAVATLDTGVREGEAIRLLGRLQGATPRGCSLPFEL
jgi:hypothetical protein